MVRANYETKCVSPLIWVIGIVPVLMMIAVDWSNTRGLVIGEAELWGRDFLNLWAGGGLIVERDWTTLYQPAAYAEHLETLFGPLDRHLYSYPPTAFVLGDLFGRLPYPVALATWTLATGALFALAARPWLPGRAMLAVLTPAALVNVWTGHYGFLLGALWLFAFRLLDRRPVVAGALIGLLAIKPQFAVLLPLVLLLRRDWRAIRAAAASATGVVGASLLLYGRGAWTTFLTETAGQQVAQIDAEGRFFGKMSASAATAILELGGGWPMALIGQGVLAAFGIALLVLAIRRGVATDRLALLAATATFLVLPYSLNYDLIVVAIGALVVLRARISAIDRTLGLIGFLAPQLGMVLAILGWPVTPLMLAGLMLAQYREACREAVSRHAVPAAAIAARSA